MYKMLIIVYFISKRIIMVELNMCKFIVCRYMYMQSLTIVIYTKIALKLMTYIIPRNMSKN